MALRCLLFSSDQGAAAPILQVLSGLGVEGEHCSDAVAAVEKVTQQNFQIVIIDWDMQPEAALLLTAARERKAAERPLTLAIVNDDVSVPQALQAGANSILRKPLLVNQVRDTLTTARDLLRAKQDSAANAALAAAAGASAGSISSLPANAEPGNERNLRAGEFLHSAPHAPGAQFVTESDTHSSLESSSVEPIDRLVELEPMAASVAHEKPAPASAPLPPVPPPQPSGPRGLEWYLKTRAGAAPAAPAHPPSPPASAQPELLGYDQTPAHSPAPAASSDDSARASHPDAKPHPPRVPEQHEPQHEQKKEAELFAYMAGESSASEVAPRRPFRLGKGAIIALVLASCAIVAAPQAPWHPKLKSAWARGPQALRGWLNPQPVTPVQAPVAHEDFGRAGDEYKLPVAENIPDATTDPSQIRVVPVIDPTIKKPNNEGANAEQPPAPDPASTAPTDQTPGGTETPDKQPSATPQTVAPAGGSVAPGGISAAPGSTIAVPATSVPPHSDPPPVVVSPPVNPAPVTTAPVTSAPVTSAPERPAPPKNPEPHYATPPGNVPSSLKSQMASMTPDASGNKPPEAAMQSIEPVAVSEIAERALLTDQPAFEYPVSARGQQGTVILQVLIGRDGTVQDAKFMQGSLAFARTAIDGVKLWKFKPYTMNGRAVSVQTLLTISFKP
jgi:periplasmic protein TonB